MTEPGGARLSTSRTWRKPRLTRDQGAAHADMPGPQTWAIREPLAEAVRQPQAHSVVTSRFECPEP